MPLLILLVSYIYQVGDYRKRREVETGNNGGRRADQGHKQEVDRRGAFSQAGQIQACATVRLVFLKASGMQSDYDFYSESSGSRPSSLSRFPRKNSKQKILWRMSARASKIWI